MNKGGVVVYPTLADDKGSYVAQYEHTFLITEDDGVIITTKPPFKFEKPESLEEKSSEEEPTSSESE
jgi:hypothetical protein